MFFPCEINAQVILLLPLAILSQEMSALKKKKKKKEKRKKINEEIKRGKCPEPRKKRKRVRREVKMDKCPTVELGVQDTHLRGKKKMKDRASHSPHKVSKSKEGMYPLKEQSRIRLPPPLLSPSSPYTIHSPHMHILI